MKLNSVKSHVYYHVRKQVWGSVSKWWSDYIGDEMSDKVWEITNQIWNKTWKGLNS